MTKFRWALCVLALCLCLNLISATYKWTGTASVTGYVSHALLPVVAATLAPAAALLTAAGIAANDLVVTANGGCMPVLEMDQFPQRDDPRHCALLPATRFVWLADVHGWPGVLGYSVGDLLLAAGFAIAVVRGRTTLRDRRLRTQTAT